MGEAGGTVFPPPALPYINAYPQDLRIRGENINLLLAFVGNLAVRGFEARTLRRINNTLLPTAS